jgi:hypothetical protein
MDIGTLIAQMRGDQLPRVGRRPLAQFGTAQRRYIGAEILPERLVTENAFRDDNIRYRTVIANAGTRYSPVQLKQGVLVGSALIELGESDIGSELTSRDYDTLMYLLASNASMDAMAQIVNFVDVTVNRALIEYNEKQRWEALVKRQVVRRGDNAYQEIVSLPTVAGHVLDASAAPWNDDDNDPIDALHTAAQILLDKGYVPQRIITRSQVTSAMSANVNVKTRTGRVTISGAGTLVGLGGRATLDDINGQLQADNLPPIETYDARYQTQGGSGPFLEDEAVVIIGRTERTEELALDNNEVELLENTLGYVGVGRAAGQTAPGRVIIAEHMDRKPPRIEVEGWQTSFPVVQDPEAYVSIRGVLGTTPT